jgi:L-alanine-DL-glutamate epimerase-like enolase superfamily enzyme
VITLRTHTFELPLRHTFTIARGSIDVQPTLIVELFDGSRSGYGEATTNTYYGATIERMTGALESVRADVERGELADDPAALWESLRPKLSDNPFAQCALDEAAHDLWGKRQKSPVYELWGLSAANCPRSNFTIGIDEMDVMIKKLKEAPGWPIYKIKLGTREDIEIVRQLRQETDAVFRVDANCGWTADEAIENSRALKELGVQFIEQPLAADHWDDARRVYHESALPIIADESCIVETDVDRCAGYFHGINIKLMKCGGLTPARRMIQRARELALQVMVGCMTESTVGISAIAQLLPLLDYVDMDGAALLASDIASGATVERGLCRFPEEPGCGVQLW